MTLNKIIPRKPMKISKELFDLGSIASLTRVLFENYIILVWLCVQTKEQTLWEYRIAALTIADNRARYRIFGELNHENSSDSYETAQTTLRTHLAKSRIFRGLSEGQQKQIMKGEKAPFTQDEVISHLKVDPQEFRRLYRFLSSFVHTNTVSFFRVEQTERTTGEFNEYEASVITGLLTTGSDVISQALSDLAQIHEVRLS